MLKGLSDERQTRSFRVESLELLGDESTVDPDRHPIEGNGPAAKLDTLNLDEIPVDLRSIAVVGLVVGVTGRQVEAAGDLLVEQDVSHGVENPRVAPDRPLSDIRGPLVRVENPPELLDV